jgi:Polysaccharide lyase
MAITTNHPTGLLGCAAALLALAAIALGAASVQPATAGAQTATASSCSGVTVTPSSRTVRRGGRVLLTGRACSGAGASSSSAGSVRINLRKGRRWASVASASADPSGSFQACVPVRVPRNAKVAQLQASSPGGTSGTVNVRVSSKGSTSCKPSGGGSAPRPRGGGGGGQTGTRPYVPPAAETGNPDCPLAQSGSDLPFTLPSACTVVTSDTASSSSPLSAWGKIDCQTTSRHQQVSSGGDPHPAAVGGSQGNSSYRSLTVLDGDNVWGERCELGLNDHRSSPTIHYHEGMRRATYGSYRLPANFPLETEDWQGVFQMKQAQPADNGGGTPVLSFGAYAGEWKLFHSEPGPTSEDAEIWSTPAEKGVWTRIAVDAFYSQDPGRGWIKVYVDRTGDGDFSDSGEQSPAFQIATLKYETGTDTSDGLSAGQSIPSQLRIGMYHNSSISCPPPTGCSIEADNIQVVKA